MTGKELFEKYKGFKAENDERIGVICGYEENNNLLLMAVAGDVKGNNLKPYLDRGYTIINHGNNKKWYWSVKESDIIMPKPEPKLAQTLISVDSIESVKMYYANEDAKPYLEIKTKSGDVHKIEHEDNTQLIEHYNSIAKDVERFVILY